MPSAASAYWVAMSSSSEDFGPCGLADDADSDLGPSVLQSDASFAVSPADSSDSCLGPAGLPEATSRQVEATTSSGSARPTDTTASSSRVRPIEITASSSSGTATETMASSGAIVMRPAETTATSSSSALVTFARADSTSQATSSVACLLSQPDRHDIQSQLLPLMRCSNGAQASVVQALSIRHPQVSRNRAEEIDRVTEYVCGARARPLSLLESEARIVKMSRQRMSRLLDETFVAMEQTSLLIYNSAAARLEQAIVEGGRIEPLAAAEHIGNDETSFMLDGSAKKQSSRRRTLAPLEDRNKQVKETSYNKVVCKLMGVHLGWSFLIRDRNTGERLRLTFQPPARAVNMDRNTGETTFQSIELMRSLFCNLGKLMQHFPSVRGHNNDRAGQNDRSFSHQTELDTSKKGKGVVNFRVGCDTHDCQTCQG